MTQSGFGAGTLIVSTSWPRSLGFMANEELRAEMRSQVLYSE